MFRNSRVLGFSKVFRKFGLLHPSPAGFFEGHTTPKDPKGPNISLGFIGSRVQVLASGSGLVCGSGFRALNP